MKGAIEKTEKIVASDTDRYVLLQQFKNPANPAIHEKTTGPESWDDADGAIDILISGVRTGGTITAVAGAIRRAGRPENSEKTIVFILTDSGERCLSSILFEGVFDAHGLKI